jgi:hypothetical protein
VWTHMSEPGPGEVGVFMADVFASVPRKDQRVTGDCYLRGLMLDGRRKSIRRWPRGCRTAMNRTCSSS